MAIIQVSKTKVQPAPVEEREEVVDDKIQFGDADAAVTDEAPADVVPEEQAAEAGHGVADAVDGGQQEVGSDADAPAEEAKVVEVEEPSKEDVRKPAAGEKRRAGRPSKRK